MEDEEIVSSNINAAGAIYAAAIFDAVRAFDVVGRLEDLYLAGQLPVGRSRGDSSLYQHWRAARDRLTTEERRSLYARTLGFAGADAGARSDGGVASNRQFNPLWLRFIAAVLEFARQRAAGLPPGTTSGESVPLAIGQREVHARARDLA